MSLNTTINNIIKLYFNIFYVKIAQYLKIGFLEKRILIMAKQSSNGSYYRINSSGILNNNMIIKELRDNFKTKFERLLNGY